MNIQTITPRPIMSDVHVVPLNGNWAVKQEHLTSYSRVTQTQAEAIGLGIELARSGATQLVIHGVDGQFRDVRSYR